MANLGWLRSRIWVALALPMGACSTGDKGKPKPGARDAATLTRSIGARPGSAYDAAPTETAPRWTLTAVDGAGSFARSWCAAPIDAAAWATSAKREGECPVEVEVHQVTNGAGSYVTGTYAIREEGGECCFLERGTAKRGRPFLDGDRTVVAESGASASAWVAAALDEHASIASFARATLELMAVGWATEPGPIEAFAPRGGGLAAVARDTFVEGCVGETIGAAFAAAARDAAEDPEEGALMTMIAEDEARHAELAWQTVAWAIAREPSAAEAVRAAADRARTDDAVWRDVIDPTLTALLAA